MGQTRPEPRVGPGLFQVVFKVGLSFGEFVLVKQKPALGCDRLVFFVLISLSGQDVRRLFETALFLLQEGLDPLERLSRLLPLAKVHEGVEESHQRGVRVIGVFFERHPVEAFGFLGSVQVKAGVADSFGDPVGDGFVLFFQDVILLEGLLHAIFFSEGGDVVPPGPVIAGIPGEDILELGDGGLAFTPPEPHHG